jgi:hypothetical protein
LSIVRSVAENISVQSFRLRIRLLLKLLNESVNTGEGFINRWVKYVNETVSYTESIFRKRALTPIVNEIQAIIESTKTFAGYIRYVNETVAIIENITKNLQYGLIVKTKTQSLFNRLRNVKLFKRGQGVKGI